MEVAGKVEVDFLHRHDLAIPATCRTPFDAEDGPKARFAQTEHRISVAQVKCIGQTYRDRGFSFASCGRADSSDKHELSIVSTGRLGDVERNLGFVVAVGLDVLCS